MRILLHECFESIEADQADVEIACKVITPLSQIPDLVWKIQGSSDTFGGDIVQLRPMANESRCPIVTYLEKRYSRC